MDRQRCGDGFRIKSARVYNFGSLASYVDSGWQPGSPDSWAGKSEGTDWLRSRRGHAGGNTWATYVDMLRHNTPAPQLLPFWLKLVPRTTCIITTATTTMAFGLHVRILPSCATIQSRGCCWVPHESCAVWVGHATVFQCTGLESKLPLLLVYVYIMFHSFSNKLHIVSALALSCQYHLFHFCNTFCGQAAYLWHPQTISLGGVTTVGPGGPLMYIRWILLDLVNSRAVPVASLVNMRYCWTAAISMCATPRFRYYL